MLILKGIPSKYRTLFIQEAHLPATIKSEGSHNQGKMIYNRLGIWHCYCMNWRYPGEECQKIRLLKLDLAWHCRSYSRGGPNGSNIWPTSWDCPKIRDPIIDIYVKLYPKVEVFSFIHFYLIFFLFMYLFYY